MRALESRGTELASKVAQLEALREVGEAIGSSLDLDEVLDRIVRNAVRLTNIGFGDITLGTDGGSIMEYDESSDSFHVRARRQWPQPAGAAAGHHDPPGLDPGRPSRAGPPASAGSRPRQGRARSPSGDPVPGRLALGARGSDAARRRHGGRAGDPSPGNRRVPSRRDRDCCGPSPVSPHWPSSTRDCSANWRPRPRSSRSRATTSRSSWPACPTNCGHR